MSGDSSLLEGKPGLALDFNFFVEDNTVVIDEADVREQGCVLVSVFFIVTPDSHSAGFKLRSFDSVFSFPERYGAVSALDEAAAGFTTVNPDNSRLTFFCCWLRPLSICFRVVRVYAHRFSFARKSWIKTTILRLHICLFFLFVRALNTCTCVNSSSPSSLAEIYRFETYFMSQIAKCENVTSQVKQIDM